MKEVSVHIVTWNRKNMLISLIESLQNQSINTELFEICICDSYSPDGTEEAVNILNEKFGNIKYFNIKTNTAAAKRNYLFSKSDLPIIISLDDDLVVDRNFIRSHYEAQKKTMRVVICGQVRFPTELIKKSNYIRFRDNNHLTRGKSNLNLEDLPAKNIVTMNMSFKKSEIEKVGYMNENFINYGGEDVEFGYRLKINNIKIAYLEDALAYHFENSQLEGYLNKLYVSTRYSSKQLLKTSPNVFSESRGDLLRPVTANDSKLKKLIKIGLNLILNKYLNQFLITYLKAVDKIPFLYSPKLYNYICAYSLKKGIVEQKNSDLKEDWL